MPVLGPLGPPQTVVEEDSKEEASTEPEKAKQSSDQDSEVTLVSEVVKHDNVLPVQSDDKENEQPQTDTVMADVENGSTAATPEVSKAPGPITLPGPANEPPPVPPRPMPQVNPQRQLIEEVEIGAQQDVTEVINNVLFQSQCAIRPISIAPDGEQLDQVKE
jgi:ubiquitin carboxyl-terminal hydrolase 25/28